MGVDGLSWPQSRGIFIVEMLVVGFLLSDYFTIFNQFIKYGIVALLIGTYCQICVTDAEVFKMSRGVLNVFRVLTCLFMLCGVCLILVGLYPLFS